MAYQRLYCSSTNHVQNQKRKLKNKTIGAGQHHMDGLFEIIFLKQRQKQGIRSDYSKTKQNKIFVSSKQRGIISRGVLVSSGQMALTLLVSVLEKRVLLLAYGGLPPPFNSIQCIYTVPARCCVWWAVTPGGTNIF